MSRNGPGAGWASGREMARSSDVAEGALPLGTVLFKVAAGSTLKAVPVVEGPRVASLSMRRGGLREDTVGDRCPWALPYLFLCLPPVPTDLV